LDDEFTIDRATTGKVVAGVSYTVAEPGPRSLEVIRQLESARLYVNAKACEAEFDRLMDQAEAVYLRLRQEFGIDVTKSTAKVERTVIDAGTGKSRKGFWRSDWQRHLWDVLGRRPEPDRLKTVITLARRYDKFIGQARQLKPIMEQI